jgi:hypothetical protein
MALVFDLQVNHLKSEILELEIPESSSFVKFAGAAAHRIEAYVKYVEI